MERPTYYAVIPASVRYDTELSASEKLLYGEIAALTNKSGECWASNTYFAQLYGVSKQAVSKWIRHLKDRGYIDFKIFYSQQTKAIEKRSITLAEVSTTGLQGVNHRFTGVSTTGLQGCQPELMENNTSINNTSINNKKNDIPNGISQEKAATPKRAYGKNNNVMLTDEEMKKIMERFPKDWQMQLDDFSDGIATKNYGYKSHYLALLRWHDMEVEKAARKYMTKAQAKKLILDNNLDMTITQVLEQVIERKGAGFI